VLESQ